MNQEELESSINKYAQEHFLSGAILISQGGEVVFEKAYGKASMQLNVLNSMDTRFHIASLTKMFIAMASLIAYEKGLLDLNERPGKYVDELKKHCKGYVLRLKKELL